MIQQCKFLEQVYKTNLTEVILQQEENFENHLTLRAIKDKLQAADRDHIWSLVSSHENLAALSRDISWMRLWDEAREQGIQGARAIATVLRVITIPVFTDNFACPVCRHKCIRQELVWRSHTPEREARGTRCARGTGCGWLRQTRQEQPSCGSYHQGSPRLRTQAPAAPSHNPLRGNF